MIGESVVHKFVAILLLLGVSCFLGTSGVTSLGNEVVIVPSKQYSSISEAVATAADGARILVKPGCYRENIRVNHKSLEIISTAGPRETIIDGNANGTVLTFNGLGDKKLVLEGFTIINGTGTMQMIGKLAGGRSPACDNSQLPCQPFS